MNEIDLLSNVMTKTGDLIEGVGDDQWHLPTPCPDYDVDQLVNHIIGWVRSFDARSNERDFDEDPSAYAHGDDPAGEFRAAADSLVSSWRTKGLDRTVKITDGEMPAEMVFNMTVMEYMTHGWDLAIATGQPVPYSDDEASATLTRAEGTLPDEYRGDAFGAQVPTDPDAPAIDRMAAFMGRRP